MKNLKMATRICITIIVTLFAGLFALWFVTNSNMTSTMRNSALDRMADATQTRAQIVSGFIDECEAYLAGYVQATEVQSLLQNLGDADAAAEMQKYTMKYASVNPVLENVYLADYGSTVVSSKVDKVIGVTLREGDSLKALQASIFATNGIYNTGIMKSPTTGEQVVSLYYPVYDASGKPIGYAGAAIYASGLMDTLSQLSMKGMESSSTLMLDMNKNTYIFCNDPEKLGAEIEDAGLLKIIDEVKAVPDTVAGHYEFKDATTGEPTIAAYTNMIERGWLFLALNEEREVYSEVYSLRNMLLIICLIVLVVVVVIVWITVSLISKDLGSVGSIIGKIGELDLTHEEDLNKYTKRKDEVGKIASATEQLVRAISDVILLLKDHSGKLYDTSESLLKASNSSVETVENVERAVHEIAIGATDQADKTQMASESVMLIGNMIQDTTKSSEKLYNNASAMNKSSDEAVGTLKTLNHINEKAKTAIDVIYKQTNNTNESAMKIREAATLITSIAEETNLLSLNASIEAARAGEQGRGFAVVASQIQKLAEQSNASAVQIGSIIDSLITDSTKAVQTMNEVKEIMEEQSSHVVRTEQIFGEVQNGVKESISGVDIINEKVGRMDKERTVVVDAVQGLAAIAEENAASTEETSSAATLVNEMMNSISESARRLSEISTDIDKNIEVFKIK